MAKSQSEMGTFAFRYGGLRVYRTEEYGVVYYCAMNGSDYACDNAESIEEVEQQIDDYWEGTEHGEANGFF